MRAGLIASVAGHAAILLWGLIAFPDPEAFDAPPVDSLPVELVPPSEFTKLRLGEKTETEIRDVAAVQPTDAAPVDAPQPEDKPGKSVVEQPKPPAPTPSPEPEPAPEPEPTPAPEPEKQAEPEPSAAPEAAPEPAPAEQAEKAPEAQPDPEPTPEPEKNEEVAAPIPPNVTPRQKPTPPRPRQTQTAEKKQDDFSTNEIAALLNKVEPSGGSTSTTQDPASLGSRRGAENVQLSQSELDALRGQISACWSPPVGAVGADSLAVRLQFSMTQDGRVSGAPQVLNSSSNPAFRAAASSAVRAVMRCAPYNLPVEKYDAWRDVIINFDPKELLGG